MFYHFLRLVNGIKVGRLGRQVEPESPGERLLSTVLKQLEVNFVPQYMIDKLNDPYARYRVADFYLPSHRIILEYLGMWDNGEEYRNKYKEKMQVYEQNKNKFCYEIVYVYPNSLTFNNCEEKLGYMIAEKYQNLKMRKGLVNKLKIKFSRLFFSV